MLFEYFAEIRTRPKEERKRFAFVATLVIMVPIVLLWVLSMVAGRPDEAVEPPQERSRSSFDLKQAVREFGKGFGLGGDEPIQVETQDPTPPQPQFDLENTFVAPVESSEEAEVATGTELWATTTENTASEQAAPSEAILAPNANIDAGI